MIFRLFIVLVLMFYFKQSISQCDTFLNIQNKKFSACDISHDSIFIVVMYGKKRCEKCFDELYECLSNLKINARYGVLFEYADNDILTKKQFIKNNSISNYLVSNYFFDVNNKFFNKYNLTHTPALIIYKKCAVQYMPYFQLFKNGILDSKTIVSSINH